METMEKTMTVTEIANRLVALCRQGDYSGAQEELYSNDASSHEPENSPTTGLKTTNGKEAIIQKGKDFQAMLEEVHGGSVSDPVIAGNHFAVSLSLDATYKDMGRQLMNEICVYEVKDGKIVKEQFIY
jgi:ketosteroid isomerase-like protein